MRKIQHFEAFGAICVFPLIQKWPEKPTFTQNFGRNAVGQYLLKKFKPPFMLKQSEDFL